MASTRSGGKGHVLSTALLFVMAVYCLLPVWWLLVSASKSSTDLFATNGLWFAEWNLFGNLADLFSWDDGVYGRWLANTLLYAGVGGVLSTFVSAAAGYALAKYEFRGRDAIFNLIIAAVLVPMPVIAFPLYLAFSDIGLVDTYWAVFLPSIVSPFGVYLAKVYAAASMPDELIDAGRVDGAGDVRIFCTVGLRVMAPALVTIFLFQFVAIWNNYLLPLVMITDNDLWPVTVGLAYWNSIKQEADFISLTVTGAFVSVVPLLIAFLTLQRFWRSGLTAGSVK